MLPFHPPQVLCYGILRNDPSFIDNEIQGNWYSSCEVNVCWLTFPLDKVSMVSSLSHFIVSVLFRIMANPCVNSDNERFRR
jgi:hypothetical protein